jgi:hypothetical protein
MPAVPPARLIAAVAASLALAAPAAHAQDGGGVPAPGPGDPCPTAYPGDGASKPSIARWMGRAAAVRGLPQELPVMAGLAESGLRNLSGPSYAGFFGMHRSLNAGPYRGFPRNPELQLRWFTDQAVLVRQREIAEGEMDYGSDESGYGLWVADVERPAPKNRSGYQPHLDAARELLGGSCTPAGFTADTVAPPLRARSARRQRSSITVKVACPAEGCVAGASAMIPLPRRPRRAATTAVAVPTRGRTTLTIRLGRRALRAAPFRTRVQVIGVDEAGNPATVARSVRVTG